ncbi:MAG: hypothetical protein HY286_05005 [Planctomycetes bacterium]|nr:hypothetical protein [Planctomycetota bacterium]
MNDDSNERKSSLSAEDLDAIRGKVKFEVVSELSDMLRGAERQGEYSASRARWGMLWIALGSALVSCAATAVFLLILQNNSQAALRDAEERTRESLQKPLREIENLRQSMGQFVRENNGGGRDDKLGGRVDQLAKELKNTEESLQKLRAELVNARVIKPDSEGK